MHDPELLAIFLKFGLAAILGFLIGLEREVTSGGHSPTGQRDFVLLALFGAISAFAADRYGNDWILLAGFAAALTLVLSGFWAAYISSRESKLGITTEVAALLTFLLGGLVAKGEMVPSIAVAIATLAVLSKKEAIHEFRNHVRRYELEATLQLLVISFIVLPILPRDPLSRYLNLPLGEVATVDVQTREINVALAAGQQVEPGQTLTVYDSDDRELGRLQIESSTVHQAVCKYEGADIALMEPGTALRSEMDVPIVSTMLEAIIPYKVWLIVVLVSAISFVGYVLVKVLGSSAGIGLTGLVGGLASSTVTTLSFAKRSLEAPSWNRYFAVAVILASSVMFPRLLVQIAFVNVALMRNIAAPLCVMGITGLAVAAFHFLRSRQQESETEALDLDNPFSLKSALKFALVFAATLMITRLAIAYLGDAWLPLVAFVSGLTDADAIAFSVSNAERAGLISLEWASFNVVLGAVSNTFMKLFLVLLLGHRGLFKQLLPAFLIIGATGVLTMVLYYDFV